MPDGWTTLGQLTVGKLFELRDGRRGVTMRLAQRPGRIYVMCALLGVDGEQGIAPDEVAREIDLPFLLMCAQDRLAESDAYARGVRDGKEAMRERAAKAVEALIAYLHKADRDEAATAIRALPLTEG